MSDAPIREPVCDGCLACPKTSGQLYESTPPPQKTLFSVKSSNAANPSSVIQTSVWFNSTLKPILVFRRQGVVGGRKMSDHCALMRADTVEFGGGQVCTI